MQIKGDPNSAALPTPTHLLPKGPEACSTEALVHSGTWAV